MKFLQQNKMKSFFLSLIGLMFAVSATNTFARATASEMTLDKACKGDNETAVCQAYFEGLVDGYIASKQKYTTTDPAPNSEYLTRVYSSRVTDELLNSSKPEPACLPDKVDKDALVMALKKQAATSDKDLDVVLYQELQSLYGC